jgi:hypothetical protein
MSALPIRSGVHQPHTIHVRRRGGWNQMRASLASGGMATTAPNGVLKLTT